MVKGSEVTGVEDKKIVDLYWERSECAISETSKKYGRYCNYIAFGILLSDADAEEVVNDTYMRAWDAMPPHRPARLSTFLGKITRNLALNRLERMKAQKRNARVELILNEVEEFLPSGCGEGDVTDEIVMRDTLNEFLASLPTRERKVCVRRYWYMSNISSIARDLGMSESNVKVTLMRTRGRLKEHLDKKGITI